MSTRASFVLGYLVALLFSGHTALEKILKGRVIDLADVKRYLDASRDF